MATADFTIADASGADSDPWGGGHGPHSRYRVVAEFNLETEDGDCFPAEVANATCEAIREMVEHLISNQLAGIGAVAVYDTVSVEHGCPQPVSKDSPAYERLMRECPDQVSA